MEVKVPVSEDVLRKAAQMLINQRMRYQKKSGEAKTEERKQRWWTKAMEAGQVHEAICRALLEAEEQEV